MAGDKGVYIAPWERSFVRIMTPLEEFIARQTTSGVLLMICAVIALFIANSPLYDKYEQILHTYAGFMFADFKFKLSLHHWINEALMAGFFFVMGLELKRELMVGELSFMAAIGGVLVPAGAYVAVNWSSGNLGGWGIPMATDIAFAIGALSLLGARVPKSLVTFLIALAIVDDLVAVAVIALFYTEEIDVVTLVYAVGCTGLLAAMNLWGIRRPLPYTLVGAVLWAAMLASGIHATIAGIVVAFVIPIRPKFEPQNFIDRVKDSALKMQKAMADNPDIIHNSRLRALVSALDDASTLAQAPAQRIEHALHLPVAYIVIPVFALANAGIPIDFAGFGEYLEHPITLGVLVGLLAGKPLGIVGFTWLTVKMGWADLPKGLNMRHILGVGMLGGIGFTMSIFIADLGFTNSPDDLLMAKTGILLASAIAGVVGFFWLLLQIREEPAKLNRSPAT
jgi:NhaA family Na+:H+ antiporter